MYNYACNWIKSFYEMLVYICLVRATCGLFQRLQHYVTISYFFLSYRHENPNPVQQWLFSKVILDGDLCATFLELRKLLSVMILIAPGNLADVPRLCIQLLLWCGMRFSDNFSAILLPIVWCWCHRDR